MSRFTRGLTVALATVCLTGVAVQASHAVTTPPAPAPWALAAAAVGTSGSIVYVKGNNLFIARGDGTHARALTTNGTKDQPYHSPSESDAGVIAAAPRNPDRPDGPER